MKITLSMTIKLCFIIFVFYFFFTFNCLSFVYGSKNDYLKNKSKNESKLNQTLEKDKRKIETLRTKSQNNEEELDGVLKLVISQLENKQKKRRCTKIENYVLPQLERINKEMAILSKNLQEAEFNLLINLSEDNLIKLEKIKTEYDNWLLNTSKVAYDLLQEVTFDLKTCNKSELRMLSLLAKSADLIPEKFEMRKKVNNIIGVLENKFASVKVNFEGEQIDLRGEISKEMGESRDYKKLEKLWESWHNSVSEALHDDYLKMFQILNETVSSKGFKAVSDVWNQQDFEEDIEPEMDRLMDEIKPLYRELHCYVRKKLFNFYRKTENEKVLEDNEGFIPAHLLGDIQGQMWDKIEDIILPFPEVPPPPNITMEMRKKQYSPKKMFRLAENFFVSLGFPKMTKKFWKNSMIEKPKNSNLKVQCHASAHDLSNHDQDFRIKMCTRVTEDYLQTVHHEMGHVVYFMAYQDKEQVFHNGANAAFHEAIGDTIGLSVMTEKHLSKIHLLTDNKNKDEKNEETLYKTSINKLLKKSLTTLVFIPYAYSLEKWRYKTMKLNNSNLSQWNKLWWNIRLENQGIFPTVERPKTLLDALGKYHVATFIPYARYFFSFIAQFQFYEALCLEDGHTGPLHECDFYMSKEAGEKLRKVLSLGSSKPWRQQMKMLTEKNRFDSESILKYFQPLKDWLSIENAGTPVGWKNGKVKMIIE